MVLQHITKRVGDFLSNKVERYCIVMQFLHHKPLLKEQEKWINPYPPNWSSPRAVWVMETKSRRGLSTCFHSWKRLACVAWRCCRAGRRSGVAAKFAREARENERRSREKNKFLPPQSPRGFSALARLYYLARPTKTAMLRRLGSARISQCIKKRFTDRTWGAANLKYFNSFIFNIPRKKESIRGIKP